MVGGQAPKAIRSVECYDFEEDRWDQIAELPSRRCRAGEQHASQLGAGSPAVLVPQASVHCRLSAFSFPTCPVASCTLWGQLYVLRDFNLKFKYLLESNKIRKATMKRNPMSPIVISKYLKL